MSTAIALETFTGDLALARAWALHPEVLLLDEPTANLDAAATREIEAAIRAFDAAGTRS
jgi:tungstate transport system ATP-binding protein